MGKDTAISWTHHTFNPWWGCEKVSPACANCYAETFAKRTGHFAGSPSGKAPLWGAGSERRFFGDKHWNEPLKWDREAAAAGERRRVFCASMADVFEDRDDLVPHRARLFDLIRRTPNLDWLLLTKRPENISRFLLDAINFIDGSGPKEPSGVPDVYSGPMAPTAKMIEQWCCDQSPPANIWLGTTVENQQQAEKRIPELLSVPARVRFLSCEPLLGPVDFVISSGDSMLQGYYDARGGATLVKGSRIDWVICGGESGAHARPMHPDWARSLRDQCAAARVPFHFKQWGQWAPHDGGSSPRYIGTGDIGKYKDSSDGFHEAPMQLLGIKRAGRLLDDVLHDAFPEI